MANYNTGDDLVSNGELCSFYEYFGLVEQWAEAFYQWNANNETCNSTFNAMDLNNDTFVDINEIIYIVRDFFELSDVKASQINCSSCLVSNYGI